MEKFYNDLKFGEIYEHILPTHIPHYKYIKMEGNFKEYDIKLYKKKHRYTTYEVKADRQINIFGNICIEYSCKNKPSGITTSTAHKWAIFEPKGEYYTLYIIPSIIIRKFIDEKKYTRTCMGGDNKVSGLYLFKKELFKDYIVFSNINE